MDIYKQICNHSDCKAWFPDKVNHFQPSYQKESSWIKRNIRDLF